MTTSQSFFQLHRKANSENVVKFQRGALMRRQTATNTQLAAACNSLQNYVHFAMSASRTFERPEAEETAGSRFRANDFPAHSTKADIIRFVQGYHVKFGAMTIGTTTCSGNALSERNAMIGTDLRMLVCFAIALE